MEIGQRVRVNSGYDYPGDRDEIVGRTGTVVDFKRDIGRWLVRLDGESSLCGFYFQDIDIILSGRVPSRA